MANHILDDYNDFREITDGRRREELKKHIKSGSVFGFRPDGKGVIRMPIKKLELPYITHGSPTDGVGAGEGEVGDKIGEKGKKKGKGAQPGDTPSEGMLVDVDMVDVWKELQEELGLPNMQPKDTPTFDDIEIKYNGISRNGPRSLLHLRRTFKETLKREIAFNQGNLPMKIVPGSNRPVCVFHPIKDDFRFRLWNEVRKPSSNACIFFVRDGSGSMNDEKCEIVSDICFWIDLWIRRFYKETAKCYIWHDTEARELSEKDFYRLKEGGGTRATPALDLVEKQLLFRFPPHKWNNYIFYFGDGETFGNDNPSFVKKMQEKLGPDKINLIGITQILSIMAEENTLKGHVDKAVRDGKLNPKFVRTVSVGGEKKEAHNIWGGSYTQLTPEAKWGAIKNAISVLLGKNQPAANKSVA